MKKIEDSIREYLQNGKIILDKIDDDCVVYVHPIAGEDIVEAMGEARTLARRVPEVTAVVLDSTSGEYVFTSDMSREEFNESKKHLSIGEAFNALGSNGLLEIFSNPRAIEIATKYQSAKTPEEKAGLEKLLTGLIYEYYQESEEKSIKAGAVRLQNALTNKNSLEGQGGQPGSEE